MIAVAIFGVIYGIVLTIYLAIICSAAMAKGLLGTLIAGTLVTLQGLVLIFETSWAPRPTRVAEYLGISVTSDARVTMFATIFAVVAGGFALAYFSGLVRWLSRGIDNSKPNALSVTEGQSQK
ncbi:hypothetical protein CQ018_08765 [Arthrobacter sp. MYb227]|nr:hypothetical protein CQ018_08765 [Arthrobacter sp. MYb227]